MLRDNLVGLIAPMRSSGELILALSIQKQTSDDRSSCLENPRPKGAESSLTETLPSPFQTEPAHFLQGFVFIHRDRPSSNARWRVAIPARDCKSSWLGVPWNESKSTYLSVPNALLHFKSDGPTHYQTIYAIRARWD